MVTLGPNLVDVPTFNGNRNHWAYEIAHQGRTIQLRQTAS